MGRLTGAARRAVERVAGGVGALCPSDGAPVTGVVQAAGVDIDCSAAPACIASARGSFGEVPGSLEEAVEGCGLSLGDEEGGGQEGGDEG